MRRNVNACVEFQRKQNGVCNSFQILDCHNVCNIYPCEIVTCLYEYPLKILNPTSAADGCCQWLYPIIFGGGLVEGDNLNISLNIGANCSVLVTSLSFPKVYHCKNNIESQQHWECNVDSGALACILPDPLVCYKEASYVQTQTVHLAPDANLVLLDWFTSGRYERGERWSFSKLTSKSSVFINGKLEFKETQNIQSTPVITLENAMKTYNIVGTCMIMGPCLETLSNLILSQIGRCRNYGEKSKKDSLYSVSPLYLNGTLEKYGCIIRFAAESVSDAIKEMEGILHPLFVIIGESPFVNK